MIRLPPKPTLTYTLFPSTPLFLSDVFRQECLQSAVERNLVLRGVEPVRFALHRHPDRCVAGLLQRLLHGPRLPERRALVLLAVGQEHRNPDVGGACQRRVRQPPVAITADDAFDVGPAADAPRGIALLGHPAHAVPPGPAPRPTTS